MKISSPAGTPQMQNGVIRDTGLAIPQSCSNLLVGLQSNFTRVPPAALRSLKIGLGSALAEESPPTASPAPLPAAPCVFLECFPSKH